MYSNKATQPSQSKSLGAKALLCKKMSKSWTIDFQLSTEQIQEAIKKHQDLYHGLSTFEFNIFDFAEMVGRNMQMPFIATALMELNGLTHMIDQNKFLQFIVQIYNGYSRSVEYHNDLHGSDVAQHCHYILRTQNLAQIAQFNELDTISLLVSALCHDVGHDGFNNKYHVVTNSERFQMYGDANVQESYHAAETLRLLHIHEYDFISGHFSLEETQLFKKRILQNIIHTDMAEMKNLRTQLSRHMERFQIENGHNNYCLIDNSDPRSVEESKQLVSNSILHACDISTSLREFELSTKWTDLLFEEFFNQGDIEKA